MKLRRSNLEFLKACMKKNVAAFIHIKDLQIFYMCSLHYTHIQTNFFTLTLLSLSSGLLQAYCVKAVYEPFLK